MWNSRSGPVRAAIGLLCVFGVVLVSSVPASAGGPTSVLIVSPSLERTASLYASDEDYDVLARTLSTSPVAENGAPIGEPGPGGRQINVTWLAHDVHVWRVDRILTDVDGGPWIYTQGTLGEEFDAGAEGTWHRSPRPAELLDVLDRMGVLDAKAVAPVTGTASAVPAAEAATRTAGTPNPPRATPLDAGAWTLAVLTAGVIAGVVGDRMVRGRGVRGRREPRHQLIDRPAGFYDA